MKFVAYSFLAILTLSCSQPISRIIIPQGSRPVTLGKETYTSKAIPAGKQTIDLNQTGRYRIMIGNTSKQDDVKVTWKDQSFSISPMSWSSISMEVSSKTVSLDFSQKAEMGPAVYLGRKATESPNILVISVDTLRADRFTPEHMPLCYEFFKKGLNFQKVYSPAPWTLPAHASMFTSLLPADHGVRLPEHYLDPKLPTLASTLSNRGYLCTAFTEGNYLAPMYGLNSGFYRYISNPPNLDSTDESQASQIKNGRKMVEELFNSELPVHFPLFVFWHTYEVHCPYLPRFDCKAPEEKGRTNWLLDHEISGFTSEDVQDLKTLYDSEVRYVDQEIFKLISQIDLNKWYVVLVSDHGEEFGEHGGLLHADTLFEEVLRVPMAIAGPGIQGAVTDSPASIIDLGPTLLSLIQAQIPESFQGVSWLDHEGHRVPWETTDKERPFISESFFLGPHIPSQNPRLLGIVEGRDKLIQKKNFEKTDTLLFDLNTDGKEQHNLFLEKPELADYFLPILESYGSNGKPGLETGELSEEQKAVLKSLGYTK